MRKIFLVFLIAILLVPVTVNSSYAAMAQLPSINGGISFFGTYNANGNDLGQATTFLNIFSASVIGATGDYQNLVTGDGVYTTFNTFQFKPFANSASSTLWSVIYGPVTYSFVPTSMTVTLQSSNFLTLSGTGTAYIQGVPNTSYAPTASTFYLSAVPTTIPGFLDGTNPGFFIASTKSVAAVPIPGAIWLMGFGLSGLFALRKRLKV